MKIPFAFPQNNDIYSDSQVAGKWKEVPFFSDFQNKKGVQCSKFCLNLEKTHVGWKDLCNFGEAYLPQIYQYMKGIVLDPAIKLQFAQPRTLRHLQRSTSLEAVMRHLSPQQKRAEDPRVFVQRRREQGAKRTSYLYFYCTVFSMRRTLRSMCRINDHSITFAENF